ncbi:MAG: hypothetical protein KJZ83_23585, partial [Burkholderiaceae bacterium]|nr:hypothetical protein [Burkholderiaceae bacterium]
LLLFLLRPFALGAEDLTEVRPFNLSEIAGTDTPPNDDDLYGDDPAYLAGRRRGQREGFRQGVETTQKQATRAAQLAASLAEQFAMLEQSVADELVDLAIEIARHTLRKAIATDRDAIVTVVQEAVSSLIDERSSFTVLVNPADLAQVEGAIGAALQQRNGRVAADASIARGGCRVTSPVADIDATIATRWQRVLASIGRIDATGVEAADG